MSYLTPKKGSLQNDYFVDIEVGFDVQLLEIKI